MSLFMDTILGESLLRQKRELNAVRLFIKIGNEPEINDLIIRLNTEGETSSQLFELGIDSRGVELEDIGGNYSPVTIEIKLSKGQKVDNITLRDTGKYYDSHKVFANSVGFIFDSDPIKDDTNLFDEWGPDILGLFPPNLQLVIIRMINKYIIETLNIIRGTS